MHTQFFEDGFQVAFDGVGGDDQFLGDLAVGHAVGDQTQNIQFAFVQIKATNT